MCAIRTMNCDSATDGKEALTDAAAQMTLEDDVFRGTSRSQTGKHCARPLTWGTQSSRVNADGK